MSNPHLCQSPTAKLARVWPHCASPNSCEFGYGRIAMVLGWFVSVTLLVGCNVHEEQGGSATADIQMTSSIDRAARRAYDGAPPVIPHPKLGSSCTECHTATGKPVPQRGFAPANPHHQTEGLSQTANCRQCHVFQNSKELFAESDFVGRPQDLRHGERLYAGAPPVMPHPVFMRENCTACHDGPSARPEIRCSHATRTNCRQCHVEPHQVDPWQTQSEPISALDQLKEDSQ